MITTDEIRHLAADVAAELPGWSFFPDENYDMGAKLSGPDGQGIRMFKEMWNSERLMITGVYPPGSHPFDLGSCPRISVSPSRGAAAIARDISRRLLPGYVALLAGVNAAMAEHEVARDARRAVLTKAMAIIGRGCSPDAEEREISLYGLAGGYGNLRLNHHGDSGEITIRGISSDMILTVLRVLAGKD